MTANEILVESYKEAVKHTNRGMFLGILISSMLYLIAYKSIFYNGITIPVLGLNIPSKETAIYSLWALYFYCGIYSNFYYTQSLIIFKEIQVYEIKKALTFYPSINMASSLQSVILSPFYLGIWYAVSLQIEIVDSQFKSILIGSILAFPYLNVLFNISSERRGFQKIRKNKPIEETFPE